MFEYISILAINPQFPLSRHEEKRQPLSCGGWNPGTGNRGVIFRGVPVAVERVHLTAGFRREKSNDSNIRRMLHL